MNTNTPAARRVVVIGAGFAGTAAAWFLRRAGADVTVFQADAGASALYCGAADLAYWTVASDSEPLDRHSQEFARKLGIWQLGSELVWLASSAGVVRTARAVDAALLDLGPLAGKRIAVADVDRDDWDAGLLARSLADSDWASRTKSDFRVVPVAATRAAHERSIAPYDFAHLHDEAERIDWLAERLRTHSRDVDAWLLGPWLGTTSSVPAQLRARLRVPIGETTSAPGGAAGARFEHARDVLFAQMGIEVERRRVSRIQPAGDEVLVFAGGFEFRCQCAIVAVGGVAAGGIELRAGASPHAPELVLSLEAPLELEIAGKRVEKVQSLHGLELTTVGPLEQVGIAADGPLARGQDNLYVAGDALAGRPRTVFEAVRSAIDAARAALA